MTLRPTLGRLDRLRKSRSAFWLNQRLMRLEARRGLPVGSIRSVANIERQLVALSYDDGPSPANTPELVEILAAADAKATFFVVGTEVERHPDLASHVAEAGHELGSHTFSHSNARDLTEAEYRLEIERGAQTIAAVAPAPTLFRPPFGKGTQQAARLCASLGLTSVLWSVDSGDTMPFSATQIAGEVVRRVKPGDIVLLHDGGGRREQTLDGTRRILEDLGGRGYRFVTVSELLREESRPRRR